MAYNKWDEVDAVAHLRQSLKGQAELILWTEGGQAWTFNELVSKLAKKYGSDEQASLYRTELEMRVRKKGETLTTLQQDISRLVSLAYPGPRDGNTETFAVVAFLRALSDFPDLQEKVRCLDPKNLDQAVKDAKRFEAYAAASRAERQRHDDGRIREKENRDRKEVRAVGLSKPATNLVVDVAESLTSEMRAKALILETENQRLIDELNRERQKTADLLAEKKNSVPVQLASPPVNMQQQPQMNYGYNTFMPNSGAPRPFSGPESRSRLSR